MTNYEWIKTLSIKELADKILDNETCNLCCYLNKQGNCEANYNTCTQGHELWLQQEHEASNED